MSTDAQVLARRLPARFSGLEPMGRGGMGLLYRGRDATTGDPVVVKTVSLQHLEPARLELLRKRFLREATALQRLSHPFIVKVLHVVDDPHVPCFVMEYVEGSPLGPSVFPAGRDRLETVLALVLDLCDAVAFAHHKGVIHRDLKPENILYRSQSSLKVLDFGLARFHEETQVTQTGDVCGTPLYMAPEQLKGEPVDPRADIYAIGVILYELLTGRAPFDSSQVFAKVLRPPPRPTEIEPDIPGSLQALVMKALSIDPAHRQATVDELKWELSACLEDLRSVKDTPLAAEDWRSLLMSDLERMSTETMAIRPAVVLDPGEVRDVTVMRVELFGLGQAALEAKGIAFVQDRLFRVLGHQVERYGGMVEQYEPRGILATFGRASPSEFDPQRAAHAGLDILDAATTLDRLLPSIRLGAGVWIDSVRLVLDPEEGLDLVEIGRALDAHPPVEGKVGASDHLAPRFEGSFRLERAEVGRCFLAGRRPSSSRGRRIDGSRVLVDRERELERLRAAHADLGTPAAGAPRAVMTLITGDAGLGKTRLVEEFLAGLPTGTRLLEGKASSYLRSPYQIVRGIIMRLLGLAEGVPAGELELALHRELEGGTFGPDAAADLSLVRALRLVMGLGWSGASGEKPPPPAVLHGEVLRKVTEVFRRLVQGPAGSAPALIWLEDIQWLDELSREVIEHFLLELDRPVLFLLTCRPPFDVPERWKRQTRSDSILLRPIGREAALQMLSAMLGAARVPETLIENLLGRAGGNPYYLRESVRYLIDCGRLVARPAGWVFELDSDSEDVPVTVRSVITSRVALLPELWRSVLQAAAVIGDHLEPAVLEMVMDRLVPGVTLAEPLAGLREAGFLTSRSDHDRTLRFAQSFVREVVYGALLLSNRKTLHGLVAQALEKVHAGRLEEFSSQLTHHLTRSDRVQDAIDLALRAIRSRLAAYDSEGTLRRATEALELIDQQATSLEARYDVLLARVRVYEITGKAAQHAHDLDDLLKIAKDLGDPRKLGEVWNRYSWYLWWCRSDYQRANEAALRAMDLLRRCGDVAGQAMALRNLGTSHSLAGDQEEALRYHRWALASFRRTGDRAGEAACLCSMGIDTHHLGRVEEALQMVEEALAIDRDLREPRGIGRELRTLGELRLAHGLVEAAGKFFTEALRSDREIGYRMGQALNLAGLGEVHREMADPDRAIDQLKEGLEVALEIDSKMVMARAFLDLAQLYRERGTPDSLEMSRVLVENALELAEELGLMHLKVVALSRQAGILVELGSVAEGIRLSGEAVAALAGRLHGHLRPQEVWWRHARLVASSRPAEAETFRRMAREHVTARAGELPPALRESYLTGLTLNREVMEITPPATAGGR